MGERANESKVESGVHPVMESLPTNIEAERAILRCCLSDSEAIKAAIAERLTPDDFACPTNAEIFRAITAMDAMHDPVDFMSLADYLTGCGTFEKLGGDEVLYEIAKTQSQATNASYYARIVRESANTKRLIAACTDVLQACHSGQFPFGDDALSYADERVGSVLMKARGLFGPENSSKPPSDTLPIVSAAPGKAPEEFRGLNGPGALAKAVCRRISEVHGRAAHAIEKISESGVISQLSPVEKMDLARELYWRYRVSEEDLFYVTNVSPLTIDKWIEWGPVEYQCKCCDTPIRLWFKTRQDASLSKLGSVYCKACDDRFDRKCAAEERERARVARVAELRSMPYNEYLLTPEWKARRDRQVEADGGACRLCGSRDNLNVHHRTYERLGEEAPLDLITLCYGCHQTFHDNRNLCKGDAPPGSTASDDRISLVGAGRPLGEPSSNDTF